MKEEVRLFPDGNWWTAVIMGEEEEPKDMARHTTPEVIKYYPQRNYGLTNLLIGNGLVGDENRVYHEPKTEEEFDKILKELCLEVCLT